MAASDRVCITFPFGDAVVRPYGNHAKEKRGSVWEPLPVTRCGLRVVVEVELVRMRPYLYRFEFAFRLVGDPEIDKVVGEDAGFGKIRVIVAQRVERLAKRTRNRADLCGFFGRQVVDVFLERPKAGRNRIDLALDSV